MRTGRQLAVCINLMLGFICLAASAVASSMEWVQIGEPLTPRARSGICFNNATNSIFLFGGNSLNVDDYHDTWEWDGSKWKLLFPAHQPDEFWGTGALLFHSGRNRVLLLGSSYVTNHFQIWEWADEDWTLIDECETMPPEWRYYGCAYDASRDMICIFGGYTGESKDELWEWNHSGWHQIEKTGNWPPVCSNPGMFFDPTIEKSIVLLDYNGQMELWTWDGTGWEKVMFASPKPPERNYMAIAYDPDRSRLVMFGGSGNRDDTWEWDGVQWHEMDPPHKPSGRQGCAFSWDALSHRVMLFGGSNEAGERSGETWFYDGSDWICVPPNPYYPPDILSGHAMAYDPREQISVLYGGSTISRMPTETFEWNGLEWNGIVDAVNPGKRVSHRMSYIASLDGIVLYGGSNINGLEIYQDTWLYRDHTWRLLDPPVSAGPRAGFAIVYDSIRDRIVTFGGVTEIVYQPQYKVTLSDETWEFDGNAWYQVYPQHHPPTLCNSGMAFDNCRGVTVLFGGDTDTSFSDKTWEYNGVDWSRIMPATTSPSHRRWMGFTFDSQRCRIVMHGGALNTEPGFDETWEWDGYDWYLIEPVTGRAPAYVSTALVYDSTRKCSVMFGGGREGYTVETLAYRHSNPDICDQMGVTLELSQTLFHTGDMFSCIAHVCNNTGDVLTGYPLLVLLDVYGSLFWAPSFTQEFDCFLDAYPSFPEGTTDVAVLPSFAWPHNAGSAQGIRFYATLTDPAIHILIGQWDMAEFGWE